MAKHIPLRQCLGCREMLPKSQLLRVVRLPDDTVVIDSTGKVSGRGAYLCGKEECLKKAIKSNAFGRALNIRITDEMAEDIKNRVLTNDR